MSLLQRLAILEYAFMQSFDILWKIDMRQTAAARKGVCANLLQCFRQCKFRNLCAVGKRLIFNDFQPAGQFNLTQVLTAIESALFDAFKTLRKIDMR